MNSFYQNTWEQTVEAIEECKLREQLAKEKGILCFGVTHELVDYYCNVKYQNGLPFDTLSKLREQQIAKQRIEYDKKERNKDNSLWLFWIVISITIVGCIVLSNY